MVLSMVGMLKKSLDSWFARKTSQLADDPLEALPREQTLALQGRIGNLDAPAPLLTFVGQKLTEAITAWRSDAEAPNMLIVLSRPVEPIGPLIDGVLGAWSDPSVHGHALLPCRHRPADPETIPGMLPAALEGSLPPAGSDAVLLSVGSLEQCFLRCIHGWSGIERLRQVMLERRDLFWLLGCNELAWKFFDHVSQINSYVPATETLPALDPGDLREWLAPLVADLGLNQLSASAGGAPGSQAAGADEAEAGLWSHLAELASGCPRIAADLWLGGLRVEQADTKGGLVQAAPGLPDLPSLTDEDRYLLHSLLIHGTMRRDHLAFSLGMPGHLLQPRIHWLLHEGLLQESEGELMVRPSHYPYLIKELANNSFFTGED